MITVTSLVRTFGRGKNTRTTLAGIDQEFDDGALTYLIGLNGTGKSTLLRLMAGVLAPSAGTVRVDGRDLRREPMPGRRLGMYLDADGFHPGHTARRHLRWLAAAAQAPAGRVQEMLDLAGLAAVADRPVGGYSLGMRQRLGVASALVGNPRTIVLDEPMNGLDVAGVLWLRALLREWADEGRCVIVADHDLAEIERSGDRVVLLEDGRVAASGTVAEIVQTHGGIERAFLDLVPRAGTDHRVPAGAAAGRRRA